MPSSIFHVLAKTCLSSSTESFCAAASVNAFRICSGVGGGVVSAERNFAAVYVRQYQRLWRRRYQTIRSGNICERNTSAENLISLDGERSCVNKHAAIKSA